MTLYYIFPHKGQNAGFSGPLQAGHSRNSVGHRMGESLTEPSQNLFMGLWNIQNRSIQEKLYFPGFSLRRKCFEVRLLGIWRIEPKF